MQRHSIKAILKTDKKNEQGHHPIYIRITIAGRSSFVSTGYYIPKTLFDRRGECVRDAHPLHEDINTAIAGKKKELLNNLVQGNIKGDVFTAKALKKQAESALSNNDFFLFADARINEVKYKRAPATIANWNKHIEKLETFNGSRELPFGTITPEYLTNFENYLREKEYSDNYIYTIMETVKGVINAARRKGLVSKYPFAEYEMPQYTPANKEHLTIAELDKWAEYYGQAHTENEKAAIVYFLFGCFTGLRISDWYLFNRKEHLKDGYIRLRAKKNGGWVTMPIYSRLSKVLELMKGHTLTMNAENVTTMLGDVAKKAGINKHISSHCARKTFAVTICLERGISSETAAELMGITLQVFVSNYSKVTPEKIRKETEKAWKDL